MDAVTMEQSQNEKTDIFANGSVWLRADFHLHTRKDKEFAQRDNNAECSYRCPSCIK